MARYKSMTQSLIFTYFRQEAPAQMIRSRQRFVLELGRAALYAAVLLAGASSYTPASAQELCDVSSQTNNFLMENCPAACKAQCANDAVFTFANLELCEPLMTGVIEAETNTEACVQPTADLQRCDPARGGDFLTENCAASCADQCSTDQAFMFANIDLCRPLMLSRVGAADTPACASTELPEVEPERRSIEELLEEEIIRECGPRNREDRGLVFLTGAAREGVTPPSCTVGRRHIICRFGVIQNHISALREDFGPIKESQYDSVTADTLCSNDRETVLAHHHQSKSLQETVGAVNNKFDSEDACLREVDDWLEAYECASPDGCGDLIDSVIRRFAADIEPTRHMRIEMNSDLREVNKQGEAIKEVSGLYDFFCS